MRNTITIDLNNHKNTISKYIYGHFAEHLGRCVYGGFWVGKDSKIPNIDGIRWDVVDALKKIRVPVLRWPGGCFADEYHWKDGVGSQRKRKKMINTHWGMVTEDHSFGTHEFLRLCELLECDPYIAGNLGSGTVQEMQDWVEYISCKETSSMTLLRQENGQKQPWKLPFFGIGNESWVCGGFMKPEFYANLYRQYQTYVKNYPDNQIHKIACGPNEDDYEWTKIVMENIHDLDVYGLSLHYYTKLHRDWQNMGHATDFGESEWKTVLQNTFFMDQLINEHSKIMDIYDPDQKIALIVDEWGTWFKAKTHTNKRFLFQQNTLRDAMSASIHFHIFHKHHQRVKMANLAQTINVLQAPLLIDDDVLIKTPTYHVFDMYQCHQENLYIPTNELSCQYEDMPQIINTASYDEKNQMCYVSLSNLHPNEGADVVVDFSQKMAPDPSWSKILTAENITAYNTKENGDCVSVRDFHSYSMKSNQCNIQMPSKSICTFAFKATD